MTPDEIKATYDELSPAEAFEAFDAAQVDNATVEAVLGPEAAREYSSFVYFNLK